MTQKFFARKAAISLNIRALALLALGLIVAASAAMMIINSPSAQAGGKNSPAIASPAVDAPLASAPAHETTVFAGGCFWGVQAVFEHVKGVTKATAGYSGGASGTAHYEMVSTGATGHAESVEVTWDPSQITYGQLLKIYFSVAHDPTELNRQGPDEGTQYRSSIFYANENQKRIAQAYIDQLDQAKAFRSQIVTQVVPLKAFYAAESYHQDYALHNPENPYIAFNDLPKVEHLKQQFPDLYVKYK